MAVDKVRKDLTDAQDNRYQVILYNPNGGSRYKKTIKGKRAALAHEAEMKVKLASGGVARTEDRGKTFREFTTEYLATRNLGPHTRRSYRTALELHLYPAIGDVKVSSLTLKKLFLDGVLNKIEAQAGSSQRRNCETLLRTVLMNAVAVGILDRSPYGHIKRPTQTRVKGAPYRIEMADVLRVRDLHLTPRPGTFENERQQHATLCEALIGTGLRIGEALAIDPITDIDVERKMLKVVRQVQYVNPLLCADCKADGATAPVPDCDDCEVGGYIYCPPKHNDASKREVPLPPFVLASIRSLQLRNGVREIALPWGETDGKPETHALLFRSLRSPDKPFNAGSYGNVLNRTGKRLGLPRDLHAHSFRHRYHSVLANAGVPQIVIDTITGHKPVGSVSHEVYTEASQVGIDMARRVIQEAWDQVQPHLAAKLRAV